VLIKHVYVSARVSCAAIYEDGDKDEIRSVTPAAHATATVAPAEPAPTVPVN
jgi:hypothetical protein